MTTTLTQSGVTISNWATAGLVPGLKVRVTSKELAEHCKKRSEYHATREKEKTALLPDAKKIAESIKSTAAATSVSNFSKGGTYSFDADGNVERLENDIKDHHNKSIMFAWYAEHLFEADYCLEGSDLVSLEILKR